MSGQVFHFDCRLWGYRWRVWRFLWYIMRGGVVVWEYVAVVLVEGDGPACYDGCRGLVGEGERIALVVAWC